MLLKNPNLKGTVKTTTSSTTTQKLNNKKGRPAIPMKTQIRLWAISAGKCEFPGCNEFLLRDGLTFSEGNYSNTSHIISWTPSGPRGDKTLSAKLAKDISNLMLTCQKHGKLIDLKKNLSSYTVGYLRECKKLHEDRIKIQTDIQAARKTTVIRLQANIRGRKVDLPRSEAYSAIINAGRYPTDEKGVLIDLTNLEYSPDATHWKTGTKQIDVALTRVVTMGNDEIKHHHLSVFGLAPIPLLVYLGYKIGSGIPADIYLNLRGKGWLCGTTARSHPMKFTKRKLGAKRGGSGNVALSIAISGSTSSSEIYKAAKKKMPIYELRIPRPAIDQITSGASLAAFRKIYRATLDEIRERHGKKTTIHLFGAMPSCAAVICGREIMHGVDPTMIVYEHKGQSSGFTGAIKIN